MKNYFEAKAKLFQMLNSSSSAVINYDDKIGLEISKKSEAKLFTGSKHKDTNIYLSNLTKSTQTDNFISLLTIFATAWAEL